MAASCLPTVLSLPHTRRIQPAKKSVAICHKGQQLLHGLPEASTRPLLYRAPSQTLILLMS